MLPSKLGDIDEAFLQHVCDENWEESSKLDFKRELPNKSEGAKKEFAKDVCAMANAYGGDLIYGIEEKEGVASNLKPISFKEESPDATKQRLIQTLNGRLEPILTGVQFETVNMEKGYILLVRVPQSFTGPHCVRDDDKRSFMMRDHISTRTLSYEELRMSFDRNGTLLKMAQDFRKERLTKIYKWEVWNPMSGGPYCVMHWIPISTGTLFSNNDFNSGKISEFISTREGNRIDKLNLDGMRFHFYGEDKAEESIAGEKLQRRFFWNAQVFRSGALEIAFALSFRVEHGETKWLYPKNIIEDLWRDIDAFRRGMLSFNVTFPIVVGLSVLSVRDYNLFDTAIRSSLTPYGPAADRKHLILPEEWIENLQETESIEKVERSIFDTLWQSFGLPKCPYYDDNGKRNLGE